jgi:hypothetical protein
LGRLLRRLFGRRRYQRRWGRIAAAATVTADRATAELNRDLPQANPIRSNPNRAARASA